MSEQACVEAVFRTASGRVRRNESTDGVTVVLGIPYAAPPFGAHRFQEPAPTCADAACAKSPTRSRGVHARKPDALLVRIADREPHVRLAA